MPEIDAIDAPRSLNRTMMDCEGHRVALTKRNHLGARLHTRPLLGEHEFAPGKISLRLREQDRHLYGKDVFTVEILMQAVEDGRPSDSQFKRLRNHSRVADNGGRPRRRSSLEQTSRDGYAVAGSAGVGRFPPVSTRMTGLDAVGSSARSMMKSMLESLGANAWRSP